MQNAKVIYSMRVYLGLVKKGFSPISTMPNPRKSNLICWVFEKTPSFEEALSEILGGDRA
jgi:hypothetical protein